MGCGCGGLPPSVTLRIEAARIAIAAGVTNDTGVTSSKTFRDMADAVHRFLTADMEPADLNAMDYEAKTAGDAVSARNNFINGPLAGMRMLREATIDKIEQAGVMQVGALVQWKFDQVIEYAQLTTAEAEILNAELLGRGLHFGMTGDELRTWIKQGKRDGKADAHGR